MTHQTIEQRRNIKAGFCRFHANVPIDKYSKSYCTECLVRRREHYPATKRFITKAQWDLVDFTNNLPSHLAKMLQVSKGAIYYQMKKRNIKPTYRQQ